MKDTSGTARIRYDSSSWTMPNFGSFNNNEKFQDSKRPLAQLLLSVYSQFKQCEGTVSEASVKGGLLPSETEAPVGDEMPTEVLPAPTAKVPGCDRESASKNGDILAS